MSAPDASHGEMPVFPFPGRPGPAADGLLGMILDGRSLPLGAPEDLRALAVTLAGLAGPAGPGELAGEAAVRSALARRASPVGVSPAWPARRKPPRRAPPHCGGRRRAGRGSNGAGRHRCCLHRRAARPDPGPRPPGDPRSDETHAQPAQARHPPAHDLPVAPIHGAWRPRAELAYRRSHGAEPAGLGRSGARAGFGQREGGRYPAAGPPRKPGAGRGLPGALFSAGRPAGRGIRWRWRRCRQPGWVMGGGAHGARR